MVADLKRLIIAGMLGVLVVGASNGFGGGEIPSGHKASAPAGASAVERKKIGPPAGMWAVERDAPLPVARRHVGQGFCLHDDYGPTYYFPSTYKRYAGLSPTYYPFYHPRLWPNYRKEGNRPKGNYCGASRSGWYWDEYDDWRRGGRYEERQ